MAFKQKGKMVCCQKMEAFYFTLMSHFHKLYYIPDLYRTKLKSDVDVPDSFRDYSYKINLKQMDDLINEALIISDLNKFIT
jgi:hypothetical protein